MLFLQAHSLLLEFSDRLWTLPCLDAPQGVALSFLASRSEEQGEAVQLKRGAKRGAVGLSSVQELGQNENCHWEEPGLT